MNNELPSVP